MKARRGPRAIALLFLVAGPAHAAPVAVSFPKIDVHWDAGTAKVESGHAPILTSPKGQKERKAIVKALCRLAEDRLRVGRGEGGRGLFSEVNCIDPVRASEDGVKPSAMWRLAASEKKGGKIVHVAVLFVPPGAEKPVELGGIDLAGVSYLDGFLADKSYKNRLARVLQTVFPADYAFPNGLRPVPRGAAKTAPKSISLFSLSVDPDAMTWFPEVEGTATRTKTGWKVDGDKGPLGYDLGRTPARRDSERKLLREREAELVSDADDSLARRIGSVLLDQVSAGYVGLRFGRVIVDRSNVLLNKVRLFSAVSEARSGPLEGARAYYDFIPTTEATVDGLPQSFGMDRFVFGWGFGFPFPWLIDRIELVPKIGRWNFEAQIAVATDAGNELRPFSLRSGLSFGLEGGLEIFSSNYLVRGWASRDFSQSIVKALKSNVTSTRAGVDALIGGPRFPLFGVEFKLAFLLFLVNDHFTIAGTRPDDQGGGQYRITIDAPFAGGGLAFTW